MCSAAACWMARSNIGRHPDQIHGEGVGTLTVIRPFQDRIGRLRHIEGIPDTPDIEQHLLVKRHHIRTMEIAIPHYIRGNRVARSPVLVNMASSLSRGSSIRTR